MSNLSKEIEGNIVTRSYRKYNLPSQGGLRIGYQEGGIEEARKAQILVDTLDQIANAAEPYGELQMISWIETARNLATTALAKYKEVTGGK